MTDKYIRFYHTKAWQSARKLALVRDHYLCQECLREGIITYARIVHHIIPLRDNWSKRCDLDNLETICPEHHNQDHPEKATSNKQEAKHLHAQKKRADVFVFRANHELK
ncbi:HNH endonuclease [Latilactobacillus curvatus]|uniref:HNH endonuclease n=1 Tax=Latilactobacillus curvatus TaxID=28038 RepID=UPI000DBB506D|nr:HNH endonuclease signature motif containing protein [Latilactobacillus curvatus]WBY48564.1 HNH endonuclease signature motif containing protein [Latilactobacillus curvatus]BBE26727.1 HNH endonuclease [Latilactobacillus curvatus]